MSKTELTKEDELLARFQINESQKFYNRANFFIAAEGIFFNAFVTAVVGSTNLKDYFIWIPIVICAIGISLNIIYFISSSIQMKILRPLGQTLNNRLDEISAAKKISNSDFSLGKYRSEFTDSKQPSRAGGQTQNEPSGLVALVYKWAPFILFVGWGIMLGIYIMQLFGIKLL